jgi:hypothetical protein
MKLIDDVLTKTYLDDFKDRYDEYVSANDIQYDSGDDMLFDFYRLLEEDIMEYVIATKQQALKQLEKTNG